MENQREEEDRIFGRLRAVAVRLHRKVHGPVVDAADVLWVPDEVLETPEGFTVSMIDGASKTVGYVYLDHQEKILLIDHKKA